MLLGEVLAERELQLDLTRLDADEPSAYRVHRALAVEAAADSRLVRLITRFEFFGGHRETSESRDCWTPADPQYVGRDRAE